MSQHKSTVVWKKAGCEVPSDYLLTVIGEMPSCGGAAMVLDGEVQIIHREEEFTPEDVQNIQREFMDSDILFWFGDHPTIVNANLQPYSLIRDGEEVKVAVCLEGDFPGYHRKDGNWADASHFIKDYLVPKLTKMLKGVDGKLEDLFSEMEGDEENNEFLDNVASKAGDRAAFAFIMATPEPKILVYDKGNGERGDYDWGYTSNKHLYSEEEKKEAQPEKKVLSFQRKDKKTPAAPVAKPTPESITDVAKPAEKTEAPAADAAAYEEVVIPSSLSGNQRKELIRQLRNKAGYGTIPGDWRTLRSIKIPKDKIKDKIKFAKLVEHIKELGEQPPTVHAGKDTAVPAVVDTGPDTLPEDKSPSDLPVAKKDAGRITQRVAFISEDMKKEIEGEFLKQESIIKAIDGHIKLMQNPTELQAQEKRSPTFWELMKWKMSKTHEWGLDVMTAFVKDFPDAAGILLTNYKDAYTRLSDKHAELIKALAIAKNQASPVAAKEEETVTETVTPEPEVKEKKKASFQKRK